MQQLPLEQTVKALLPLLLELGYETSTDLLLPTVQSLQNDPTQLLSFSLDGEHIVGFVHASIRTTLQHGQNVEIHGLVVDSTHQKQGRGKALLQQVEDWAKEKQISSISLSSNVFRKGAHDFYEKQGFVKTKEQMRFSKKLI